MEVKIVENRKLAGKDFLLTVEVPDIIANKIKPGQFAMVDVRHFSQTDPLLKRPLGIFNIEGKNVSFIYRVVGRGTKLLTEMEDKVDLILPLGNYFIDDVGRYLFIAGGIGIGGVFLAAKKFLQNGKKVKVVYGGREEKDLSAFPFLKKYDIPFLSVTEDGSCGKKGLVTDFISEFKDYRWVACGSSGMLRAVKNLAKKIGVECYVSIDERMACGVGGCLGCVVKTKSGYKRTCVEGPIFKADEVEI